MGARQVQHGHGGAAGDEACSGKHPAGWRYLRPASVLPKRRSVAWPMTTNVLRLHGPNQAGHSIKAEAGHLGAHLPAVVAAVVTHAR